MFLTNKWHKIHPWPTKKKSQNLNVLCGTSRLQTNKQKKRCLTCGFSGGRRVENQNNRLKNTKLLHTRWGAASLDVLPSLVCDLSCDLPDSPRNSTDTHPSGDRRGLKQMLWIICSSYLSPLWYTYRVCLFGIKGCGKSRVMKPSCGPQRHWMASLTTQAGERGADSERNTTRKSKKYKQNEWFAHKRKLNQAQPVHWREVLVNKWPC